MITELFLEGNRVDISADISSLLTFAIDDVKDFASRQTTFSKTVVLPGTARNNSLFGNIFETGSSNDYNPLLDNIGYNFNASKSARCIIFQDNLQTFKGTLRLLQINKDKSNIEYEVALNGELTTLNVALSSGYLDDLDFSAYDSIYSLANIVGSWDNSSGSGIYYPLIDYGTYSPLKHDWDVKTFRPALYVKEYIDKMFSAASFRYDCDLFDTARFKGFIVPHNYKNLTRLTSGFVSASSDFEDVLSGWNGEADPDLYAMSDKSFIPLSSATVSSNFNDLHTSGEFQYNQAPPISVTVTMTVEGTLYGPNPVTAYIGFKGGATDDHSTTQFFDYRAISNYTGGYVDTIPFSFTITKKIILNNLDSVRLYACTDFDYEFPDTDIFTLNLKVTSFTISSDVPTLVDVQLGETVVINDILPKNIKQIDFLSSIIKLFNLYVYESQFDERLINIKPFVDFYSTDSANAVDWTYKLNRDLPIVIKPMSELNSKVYNFNYKDDSDFFNDQYKKRYNQGYGSYIFDSQFEFASQSNTLELIFAGTPLVGWVGEDKIYSTIFKKSGTTEETIDSVIRILQTKKVTGVTSWNIKSGASVLGSYTTYGYAGHLDDPDNPTNDLNFGVLQELYFTLITGDLTVTQFNVYWSSYMAEITDKDSKMLIGKFYLTPKDIFDLDFSKYVYLDGVLFRLNKITDYNATIPNDCEVQLLKIINTFY